MSNSAGDPALPQAALGRYLTYLQVERGLADNTLAAYARDLAQYRTFLDGRPPSVQTSDAFVQHLSDQDLAPATIHRKLAAVRGFHRWAVVEDAASDDPTRLLGAVSLPEAFPKSLSVDEAIRLVEAPDPSNPLGRRDRALLEFMYATGARVAETVGLDLRDVDAESRTALVTGKGAKQRIVPLGSAAMRAISDYLPDRLNLRRAGADDGALFLNRRGGRLTRQGIWGIVKRHAVRVGISSEQVSPHVLRHSAATHMVEAGADIRTVQEMLGHANISTTQVYTRMSLRHLREVYTEAHPRS